MQTVSNEFKEMCKSNTPSGALGRIVVENNSIIAENNDIQDISIEDNCYVNDKFIGTTVAKKITVNLFNDDNMYDLENKEVEARLGFNLASGEELISYGNFIIEKPNTEEVQAKTNFTGYDYMIKFDVPFVDNNTYPVKLGTYFSNLCTQVGLVAGNTDFINSDYMVLGNPFTNNETCRTVLSAIAQIAGGIAKIGRDNKPYIINLSKETDVDEIDGNNYDTFTPNKVFGPINKVIIKMNNGVEGEESVRSDEASISQDGECAITISDNPILNSAEQRELVIDNIFNALQGVSYLPYKTTYYGYPYIDSTDKIKIFNVNDTEYKSYVFNHSIRYDGTLSGSIETSALTKTQSMYKNTSDFKAWKRNTELKVDKINGEITALVKETTEIKKDTISKVEVLYALSDSETEAPTDGWSTTAPSWTEGMYMWQKTVITYADGTEKTSATTCISGAGGKNGKDGTDGKSAYQIAVEDGFEGSEEEWLASLEGKKGDTGIGVSAIVSEYYLSTSNETQEGGTWSEEQQEWEDGKYFWTRSKITWTDGTTTYTDPILAEGINNANENVSIVKESVAEQKITIDSIQQTVSETQTIVGNNYNELKTKFDDYAPKSDVITLQTSVEKIQTDTYTKTEINTKLTDGSVTKVSTTAGTFDENGLTIEKTNAKTKGNFNETGITVTDATSGSDEELLFAGYDEDLGETIVRSKNMTVEKYFVVGNTARQEKYTNPVLGGKGIGVFIL